MAQNLSYCGKRRNSSRSEEYDRMSERRRLAGIITLSLN